MLSTLFKYNYLCVQVLCYPEILLGSSLLTLSTLFKYTFSLLFCPEQGHPEINAVISMSLAAGELLGRYFFITYFTHPPDGLKNMPVGTKIRNLAIYLTNQLNFQTLSYALITDPPNKIVDLRLFFLHSTNRSKYFEAEIL